MGMYFDPVTGQWYPTSSVPTPIPVAFEFALADQAGNSIIDDTTGFMLVQGGVILATRLTVTILADGTRDGETRRAECVQAAQMLARVGQQLVSTEQLTGTILDANGVATASYVYTPTAPA